MRPSPRRRGAGGEVKRISHWQLIGFGIILALLVSIPLSAFVAVVLGATPKYVLMAAVPVRGDGAYLQVNDGARSGVILLFPWYIRLDEFPADAPIFNPAHITALIISQRGLDNPAKYTLFHLDDNSLVPFDVTTRPTQIIFTPRAPLATGNYLLDMPRSGMFSDRQYLYFRVDETATKLPIE